MRAEAGTLMSPTLSPRRANRVHAHHQQNGGAVTDLQQQLGHAELATTQIYANALSERRRATVLAMEFAPAR